MGDITVNRPTRFVLSRGASLVVLAGALALAGCGRKGMLDLPPQASAQSSVTSAPSVDPDAQSAASKGRALSTPSDDGPPQAATGRKRSFILDPLLD